MRGKNFNLVYKCWRKNIDIRKITPSLFLLTGEVSAFCRRGEVNHFPAFLVHFPAENVDFTAISPFFPGKVNHIAANLVHFPPELGVGTFPRNWVWRFRIIAANRGQLRNFCSQSLFFIVFFYLYTQNTQNARNTRIFTH